MSSAGVAAKMALKSITAVSAGDLNIGQTAQAGQTKQRLRLRLRQQGRTTSVNW